MGKRILVIGNGFDLHCKLKSSYDDFFKWRMNKLFGESKDFDKIRDDLGIENRPSCESVDFFSKWKNAANTSWPSDITRWDCIFLIAEKYLDNTATKQWQDVENIIFNVVSIVLWPQRTNKRFASNLAFKDISRPHPMQTKINYYNFSRHIKNLSGASTDSLETKANNLFEDLQKFEKIFAQYIAIQQTTTSDYQDRAKELLEQLIWDRRGSHDDQVDVLSFNYTLDPRFIRDIQGYNNWLPNLHSWTNVHGVAVYNNKGAESRINNIQNSKFTHLSAPIFGIDSHDILDDSFDNDLRLLFTKSYRLVNSNIISTLSHEICKEADTIIFYGHSLSRADYSYFETLFDNAELYKGSVKLEFFYHVGDNPMHDREQYTSAVFRLLTNYGQTLGSSHGENIVNKLILERRLAVIPDKNNHLSDRLF